MSTEDEAPARNGEAEFDSRVHFACHGVAGVALLLCGWIPTLALYGLIDVVDATRLFMASESAR